MKVEIPLCYGPETVNRNGWSYSKEAYEKAMKKAVKRGLYVYLPGSGYGLYGLEGDIEKALGQVVEYDSEKMLVDILPKYQSLVSTLLDTGQYGLTIRGTGYYKNEGKEIADLSICSIGLVDELQKK